MQHKPTKTGIVSLLLCTDPWKLLAWSDRGWLMQLAEAQRIGTSSAAAHVLGMCSVGLQNSCKNAYFCSDVCAVALITECEMECEHSNKQASIL